jgi:hypothetical protein
MGTHILGTQTVEAEFAMACRFACRPLPCHPYRGSEGITPILLARRFTLNPVLVITSLNFWYWMWVVAGAILAVFMLATLKLVCDHIESLMAFGHFLGTDARKVDLLP